MTITFATAALLLSAVGLVALLAMLAVALSTRGRGYR